MEAQGVHRLEEMVEVLASRKQRIAEFVATLPKSSQEYLELPLEQRMSVASDVLRFYAPNATGWDGKGEGRPVPVKVTPSDTSGIVFEGEVVSCCWTAGSDDRLKLQQKPGIEVYATAVDVEAGLDSGSKVLLGGIERGPYVDTAGENQTGWHAWSKGHSYTDEHPLTEQFGAAMVEFVDVAVAGLLDGEMLTQHRKFIGGQAVEGAVQPVD